MTRERSTVGSLLRSTQAYCQQLCEKQTLDHGIAFYSSRYPFLSEVNQFREVVIENAADIPAAFDEAERWFLQQGLICQRWAPAMGEAIPELSDFLGKRGYERRRFTALVLTAWVELATSPGVRVLHARAMRAAFRQTCDDRASTIASATEDSPASREMLVQAHDERLNDPSFDMFVALVDKQPAGHGALYQVGDCARIMDVSVLASFAGRGVDQAILAHVLALAKRLAIRHIVAQVDEAEPAQRVLFASVGFTPDGVIEEFHRARPISGR